MIETLNNLDTQFFYLINGHHCLAMDWVMWFLSSRWSWILVLVTAYLLVVFKQERKLWWLPLAAIGLCFLLADRGSVLLFKETVCRLRPCHALPDVHLFKEGCGGQYGFVSSHAANAFALVSFFWLRYRRTCVKPVGDPPLPLPGGEKWRVLVPLCMLVWAVLLCYSRVYLGKHYPGDILCGALFGVLVGGLVWYATKIFEKKLRKNETKK